MAYYLVSQTGRGCGSSQPMSRAGKTAEGRPQASSPACCSFLPLLVAQDTLAGLLVDVDGCELKWRTCLARPPKTQTVPAGSSRSHHHPHASPPLAPTLARAPRSRRHHVDGHAPVDGSNPGECVSPLARLRLSGVPQANPPA